MFPSIDEKRLRGVEVHHNREFDCELISHVYKTLYVGGVDALTVLPSKYDHVISLYHWEKYRMKYRPASYLQFTFYDSNEGAVPKFVEDIGRWTYERSLEGTTLVHCQAGINRSPLVLAIALTYYGMTGKKALALIREKRSEVCFSNDQFYDYVMSLKSRKQ